MYKDIVSSICGQNEDEGPHVSGKPEKNRQNPGEERKTKKEESEGHKRMNGRRLEPVSPAAEEKGERKEMKKTV